MSDCDPEFIRSMDRLFRRSKEQDLIIFDRIWNLLRSFDSFLRFETEEIHLIESMKQRLWLLSKPEYVLPILCPQVMDVSVESLRESLNYCGYITSFIRFSLKSSDILHPEIAGFRRCLNDIQILNSGIKLILRRHERLSAVDEDRGWQCDICIGDILRWIDEKDIDDEEGRPMTILQGESNTADALKRLRRLYSRQDLTDRDTLMHLQSIMIGNSPNSLASPEVQQNMSEHNLNTTVIAINAIVYRIFPPCAYTDVDYDSMIKCHSKLSKLLREKTHIQVSELANETTKELLITFSRMIDAPLDVIPAKGIFEITLLWQKLHKIDSVQALLELAKEDTCMMCRTAELTPDSNFTIFDQCRHLFCLPCVRIWFRTSRTCPYCRTDVDLYTTREEFQVFLQDRKEKKTVNVAVQRINI